MTMVPPGDVPVPVLLAVDGRRLGQVEQHDTLAARNSRLAPGDLLTLRVRRSEITAGGDVYQEFRVPYQKWMRVLDALNWIAENAAPDLAFRWFCGSKMCGTCAVRMNGREVLACWEAVEPNMVIEPLRFTPLRDRLAAERLLLNHFQVLGDDLVVFLQLVQQLRAIDDEVGVDQSEVGESPSCATDDKLAIGLRGDCG